MFRPLHPWRLIWELDSKETVGLVVSQPTKSCNAGYWETAAAEQMPDTVGLEQMEAGFLRVNS